MKGRTIFVGKCGPGCPFSDVYRGYEREPVRECFALSARGRRLKDRDRAKKRPAWCPLPLTIEASPTGSSKNNE